jgi:hypothetical protein
MWWREMIVRGECDSVSYITPARGALKSALRLTRTIERNMSSKRHQAFTLVS